MDPINPAKYNFPPVEFHIRNTDHRLTVPNVLAIDFAGTYTTAYPNIRSPWYIIADAFTLHLAKPPSTFYTVTVHSHA